MTSKKEQAAEAEAVAEERASRLDEFQATVESRSYASRDDMLELIAIVRDLTTK